MAAVEMPDHDKADATVTVRVVVAARTQVNNDGVIYGEGEVVELPKVEATRLLAAGIVLEQ